MGAVATAINGLLSQIATQQSQLAAAQANSLDASDQAAVSAANSELATWNASQATGSGSSGSASGSSASGSSGSGSVGQQS